ncbi:MAG TPA: hypothetical protein VMW36_03720 [Patescibacteria group bacterium]|nr:hypothetical protein [Patescibacteria group bacterium]
MQEEAVKQILRSFSDKQLKDPKLAEAIAAQVNSWANKGIFLDKNGRVVPCNTVRFIDQDPSFKQRILLEEQSKEILYGGGLGGGKTVGIMHLACQYAHIPGYHGIIFRRTAPNCQDLIDRLTSELHGKAVYNGSIRGGRFTFPSNAIVDIGYMQHVRDRENYKGFEYQTIIFEEVTEFLEKQYTFMFSRLRAKRCPIHKGGFDPQCKKCSHAGLVNRIPRRVVATCNPDGEGLLWVKERFITNEIIADIEAEAPRHRYEREVTRSVLSTSSTYKQCFIPAYAHENPGIDSEEYIKDVTAGMTHREALANIKGWWTSREGAIFEERQFKTYKSVNYPGYSEIYRDIESGSFLDDRKAYRFVTVDVAHTSAKKAKAIKRNPSWSVATVWDWFDEQSLLFLRYVWRKRVDWLDLRSGVFSVLEEWNPSATIIEDIPGSKSLIQEVDMAGHHVKSFNPSRKQFKGMGGGRPGKLDRSHAFQLMLERGEIYIPDPNSCDWVQKYISEMIMWSGMDEETSDQVDCSSMAALEVYQKPQNVRQKEYEISEEINQIMITASSGCWNWR